MFQSVKYFENNSNIGGLYNFLCSQLFATIRTKALTINKSVVMLCEYTFMYFHFFSSPEHKVLMVSYCDQSLSVVRALSTFCFKQLLLQNHLTDFKIILQEGSLGDPLPKLLKPFRSIEQDGRQS